MKTSETLLQHCDQHIAALQKTKNLIVANATILDRFGSGSVGAGSDFGEHVFLHDPPAAVKEFCRAVGGDWKRERGTNEFNYALDGEFRITIFGAEEIEKSQDLRL